VTIELQTAEFVPSDADAIVRGVPASFAPLTGEPVDRTYLERTGFAGKVGESAVVRGVTGPDEVLVGIGEVEKLDPDALRLVGAAIARATAQYVSVHVELRALLPEGVPTDTAVAALAVGAHLAAYRFDRFKSEPKPPRVTRIVIVGPPGDEIERALRRGDAVAGAVAVTRDLVNTPAGDLPPRRLAEIAVELGAEHGFAVSVLGVPEITELGLGGLLGVAAGSVEPPRFVTLRYTPEQPSGRAIALVGKGITFDSGGLSLKSGAGMMSMKTDMGGAAAVLGAFCAFGALGVTDEVRGYLAITENMPSGSATRPGDVLRTRNGKTIEVLNTDAEGRLVLADALALAIEEAPDAIVDLATLTGACVVALGNKIAGLLGNDDRVIAQVQAAARRAGEAVWPLPLPAGYRTHIDSEIADMKNIGATGQAGTLAAALLLAEFVDDVPWAHLDIAGPVRTEEDRGYLRKGATGFGVATLIEFVSAYAPLGGTVEGEAEGIGVLR
jgi:leucyl aminopeptidase